MPNEAVDRLSDDQSITFPSGSQTRAGAHSSLPADSQSEEAGMPAPPGLQPRPALTLVNGNREISYESYECFIGVSPNVHDLKKFIGVHASQTHPVLLIGERGLRQEQIARVQSLRAKRDRTILRSRRFLISAPRCWWGARDLRSADASDASCARSHALPTALPQSLPSELGVQLAVMVGIVHLEQVAQDVGLAQDAAEAILGISFDYESDM